MPPPLLAAPPAPVTAPFVVSSPAPRAVETWNGELVGLIVGIGILILLDAVVRAAGYGISQ